MPMDTTESTTPPAAVEPNSAATPGVLSHASRAPRRGRMESLKAYLVKYFEQTFVLLTLLVTVFINYHPLISQKLAFLNFYFLPIILAGYYLGRRKAVLGAVLSVLAISLYVYIEP